MRVFRSLSFILIASLLMASVTLAHHSFAMFDKSVEKVASGTVVRWAFSTPHSWLYMNIKEGDKETLWSFEGSAPPSLLQRGVTGNSFKPGDTIKPEQLEGAEDRTIEMRFPQRTMTFTGRDFLFGFSIPNFLFHVTTAYAILRSRGVPLGKMEYLAGGTA